MNILTIGKKIDKIKSNAKAEIPKITAYEAKVEAAVRPIFDAVLQELLLKGTVTQAMVDNCKALLPEGKALVAEFIHLAEDAEKDLS